MQLLHLLDRFPAVLSFGRDIPTRIAAEERSDTSPHNLVIIHKQDVEPRRHLRHHLQTLYQKTGHFTYRRARRAMHGSLYGWGLSVFPFSAKLDRQFTQCAHIDLPMSTA
jgi:hypothetical protein